MDRMRTFDYPGTTTVSTFPSLDEINRHVARARALRAEATAQMLATAGRGVADVLRPLRARLARWDQQSRTAEALRRCSDRVLADIGIERAHIDLVARGIDPRTRENGGERLARWWAGARSRLEAAQGARRERQRVYRELMAYSDPELDELGVRRPDIPAIARGDHQLRHAA
jgi:uncharacterized protein YjiS (DUF1127 family)